MEEKAWGTWLTIIVLFTLLIWLMEGCAWKGALGDGCVLCDFVPPSAGKALTEPLVIQAGQVRFNGSAVVVLDWGLNNVRGEIFQALQTGCGLTRVDAVDGRYWSSVATPTHDYRVEVSASSSSWRYGVSTVSVNATLSRNTPVSPQYREYRFVKNGSGAAYYGGWYDYYYGRPRYTSAYRSYEEALRVAIRGAMLGLCGYALPGVRSGGGSAAPQVNPSACLPPTCYESEQTISLYGTWGGPGIYSHWPVRPAQQEYKRRRDDRRQQGRRIPAHRAPVYKGR